MIDITELYFASHNPNKLKEVSFLFDKKLPNITIQGITDLAKKDQEKFSPEETGTTFLENAWIKACCLAKIIPDKLIFSEDSGLVVPALGGAPGVFSSRYANTDKKRIQRLLKEASKLQGENRKAYFFASVCFIQGSDKISFHGKIWGEIAHEASGQAGFGYDPIFYVPHFKKNFAELSFEEKQTCSHRKKSIDRLIQFIINSNQKH